ncbi:hypothetical protein HYH02_001693 [Chlamydomonas schloesseri]|uniref:Glycosyl transferase family 28 C-terminal domain-containing protein n=1 Tax=Chlamydomonas schloesseri TaxID=2026947 RepID=A0A836BBD2_9CHLO|nr:hypothetical protein HYH02_001693 [Chlamydomonas schloesseri]|eukprot:KAG2453472.1 hypothetical protein HYH02_001693 [Chlamydomonas schloesseri]
MGISPQKVVLGAVATAAAGYGGIRATLHVRRQCHAAPVVAFAGCHVYSGLALAEALHLQGVESVFLGTRGVIGSQYRAIPAHGFHMYEVPYVELVRPLKRMANVWGALRFPFCVLSSGCALVSAAPDALVGIGGSVSVPACLAAFALGIPLLVYEPNARAGAANASLHRLAERTLLAFPAAASGLKYPERCVVIGPAVRPGVLTSAGVNKPGPDAGAGSSTAKAGSSNGKMARCGGGCDAKSRAAAEKRRAQAREALGLKGRSGSGAGSGSERLLVVMGGSKGCCYLNQVTHNVLPQLANIPGLQVLWQTGIRQHVAYAGGHAATMSNVRCVPHISDVGSALAAADLVLSRAGAASVAELGAVGAPCLLVPSPAVDEERQTANAQVLMDAGLAELVPQLHVDEHGIAGRLLPLLAPDGGKRLAAMKGKCCSSCKVGGSSSSSSSGSGLPGGAGAGARGATSGTEGRAATGSVGALGASSAGEAGGTAVVHFPTGWEALDEGCRAISQHIKR